MASSAGEIAPAGRILDPDHQEEQGEHIKDKVHVIGVHKPIAEKTVVLVGASHSAGLEDEVVVYFPVIETCNRYQAGNDNNNDRYRQHPTNIFIRGDISRYAIW